jgi:dipeptidyl aminopeptidase/acylaminoacyl peptidase
VAVNNVPRTEVRTTTPAQTGLAFTDVEFVTADGVRLSGWYIPSVNGAAVVALHGAGSTRSDVLDHAVVLARHGYGVLLFDARGHGRSGGRAMDFGWYGDLDTAAAVSFLAASRDVDRQRIAAVGLSMGGEMAIGAAASDPRIRAVVAEGATNRVAADKNYLSEAYGIRGAIQEGVDWLMYAVTDLLTSADAPMSLRAAAAAAAPRPLLLIAGGAVPDEPRAASHIQRDNAAVQVWEVPDTGHTRALYTQPAQWEQRVIAFLDNALGRPAS